MVSIKSEKDTVIPIAPPTTTNLFDRDNRICHLCSLPIPQERIRGSHVLGETMDHIIPRSLGGSDKRANKLPAHATCNWWRGSRDITEDLKSECFHVAVAAFSRSSELAIHKRTGKGWIRLNQLVETMRSKG